MPRARTRTPPVHFTSTFIVTPLAPYELILGIGWLEQHDALHRLPRAQHPAARRRRGQAALHPPAGALQRRRQRGGRGGAAAAQGHRAEARVQAAAQGQVEQLYAVLIRPAEEPGDGRHGDGRRAAGQRPPARAGAAGRVQGQRVRRAEAGRAAQARRGARHPAACRARCRRPRGRCATRARRTQR